MEELRISDVIAQLMKIKHNHGNLAVETSLAGRRCSHHGAKIAHRKILKGRESSPCFASSIDDDDRRGDKVCKL